MPRPNRANSAALVHPDQSNTARLADGLAALVKPSGSSPAHNRRRGVERTVNFHEIRHPSSAILAISRRASGVKPSPIEDPNRFGRMRMCLKPRLLRVGFMPARFHKARCRDTTSMTWFPEFIAGSAVSRSKAPNRRWPLRHHIAPARLGLLRPHRVGQVRPRRRLSTRISHCPRSGPSRIVAVRSSVILGTRRLNTRSRSPVGDQRRQEVTRTTSANHCHNSPLGAGKTSG